MERRISTSAIRHNHTARTLLRVLDEHPGLENAIFYYEFPLFRDTNYNQLTPEIMLVSKTCGVAIVAIDDTGTQSSISSTADSVLELDGILFSKFMRTPSLRIGRRASRVPIACCVYAPGGELTELEDVIIATTLDQFTNFLDSLLGDELSESEYENLVAIIEGGSAIVRASNRTQMMVAESEPNKATALTELESKVSNFDKDQRLAAIAVVDGPQQIRGLAGSGKTIVLCMKAAQIHLRDPTKRIVVTFWTRSLYGVIKQTITRFFREFSDGDPDWDVLEIAHAWGGRSRAGVYFNACIENGVPPLALRDIPSTGNKFGVACAELTKRTQLSQKYDYVLIDEGQDLPIEFYRLCFLLCKGDEVDRNVVWAYDDLQTILDVRIQNIDETFGLSNGIPLVDLSRAQREQSDDLLPHDIVLQKCYRNSREVLMVAHALGFGLYSDQIVQMLENENHWNDLGYRLESGACEAGSQVTISRPQENSPVDLSEIPGAGESISYFQAANLEDETDWAVREIRSFLEDGLNPEDILVISLDDRNARTYFGVLVEALTMNEILVNNVLANPVAGDEFFVEDHITLSTVYRAKGNEAAAVIVLGIDALAPNRKTINARNRLFTAISRAKAWLRISGITPGVIQFCEELDQALTNIPNFEFVYPDLDEISMIQRDLNERSQKLMEFQQLALELELTEQEFDSIAPSIKKRRE